MQQLINRCMRTVFNKTIGDIVSIIIILMQKLLKWNWAVNISRNANSKKLKPKQIEFLAGSRNCPSIVVDHRIVHQVLTIQNR